MLLFTTFRHLKNFKIWKEKKFEEMKACSDLVRQDMPVIGSYSQSSRMTTGTNASSVSKRRMEIMNQHEKNIKEMQKLENWVLLRMKHLLKTMVRQMNSYSTPMAPFAQQVIDYVVKFFIGEEYTFGSSQVLAKTTSDQSNQLKEFLKERSFFRNESDLTAEFKEDVADRLWHLE